MTLFAVTLIEKSGNRAIMGPAQGRYMWDSRHEAEAWLGIVMRNTGEDRLVEIHGPKSRGTFRVDPVDCYDNRDPKGIYID